MTAQFDQILDRRHSDSIKWNLYDEDVIPMWVADMDFLSPQPILEALHERVANGTFGYAKEPPELADAICDRLDRLYDWKVSPNEILYLPGLVVGLNLVNRTVGAPGDHVLVNAPVYGPFFSAARNNDHPVIPVPQREEKSGGRLYYLADMEEHEAAVTPQSRLYTLCNPHNPTGRAWSRGELESLADFAERHDLIVCSDEIHCDLLHRGQTHTPFASISPEVSRRTITLMAPSKTFNIPSLGASFAVAQDKALFDKLCARAYGSIPHQTPLAAAAMLAAYTRCDDWLAELREYLTANRDFAVDFFAREMPQLSVTCPEATYLLWIDCRDADLGESPDKFFLEEARVGLSDGRQYGTSSPGKARTPGSSSASVDCVGYLRLNFGCPRATLEEGLTRMRDALARRAKS